jgi:hypothetical protein
MVSPGAKEPWASFCEFLGFRGEESLRACAVILERIANSNLKMIPLSEAHKVSGTAKWVTQRLRRLGLLKVCKPWDRRPFLCPNKKKLTLISAVVEMLWPA